jgi:predicted small lipoprotein YifL
VSLNCDRHIFRLALIGALAAALSLAACGRKGPLDPPPSVSLTGKQATPNKNSNGEQVLDSHGRPHAPPGPDKQLPIDGLLN